MARKSLYLIFIKDSFHRITHAVQSFLKDKTVRKGSPKQKFGADIIKMLDDIKVMKVMVKITTGRIKVIFGNSLMQKY
jgi:hypothetical protein